MDWVRSNISLYRYIALIALLAGAFSLKAQEERKFIRKGNKMFNDSAYVKAEIDYRKALEKNKDSYDAQFNLGDALFKQQKYDKAAEQFEILAGTHKDKKDEKLAKVYHNLGNSYFAQKKYEKSIEAYKNSLRINPNDNETRYNLIAAMKMLQQQKNQNKNKNKNQNKNKDKNKDKQKQDQQRNKQDQNKDKQKQNKDQQQQQDQQKQQEKKQQQQQQQQQKMSQQDAQRLLNAIQQDENELQKKLRKAKATKKAKSGKNW